jgi:hypothetical protein
MEPLSMSELSPATSAILDAYWETFNAPLEGAVHRPLAAALRAAVDQVVPEMPTPWNSTLTPKVSAENVRAQLLAIADELEAQ